ncbi:MAG TPA: SsrA-binding protein SmpB [Bacilli bacterium]|nr:SsrA-binding protein SmpB [Bacilli bacterium]
MEILNRKAKFNYFIEEEYECGIVLEGTEIKSVREGSCDIKDSYAIIKNNELFILNMYIKKYQEAGTFNHIETRTRKLLMHKKEIKKLNIKLELEGYTLIPLKVYLNKNKVKILLGLCKGKKNFDKRETMKERDIKIDIKRQIKGNN